MSAEVLPAPGQRVVVAMSGGVDSSTVAALLHARGCEVIGITLALHDAPDPEVEGGCCTPDDVRDARRVCAALGVPHYVLNYREVFRRKVIEPFLQAYREGRTPNPCVLCNHDLKFDRLLDFCAELKAGLLATGHYARLVRRGSGVALLAGRDPAKDQSYFLYGVRREALSRLCFPLGALTKPEVRAAAERLGVRTSAKPDSQDVCFIPGGRTAEFLAAHGAAAPPGRIVDERGRDLGAHPGVHAFTVGQRRGLGLPGERPLYVRRIDAAARRLVVAERDRLAATELWAEDMNWLRRPAPGEPLRVRVRYRSRPAAARIVEEAPGARWRFDLAEAVQAAAPGQAVVLYGGEGGDEVLGGGTLLDPEAVPPHAPAPARHSDGLTDAARSC